MDIDGLSTNIEAMARDVHVLTGTVLNMESSMERMGYDIHQSSRSFRSPMRYFENMGSDR